MKPGTGADGDCAVHTGRRSTIQAGRRFADSRLYRLRSVWPAGGVCREISASGDQNCDYWPHSDRQLHQPRRAEGLHDRRDRGGAGVLREKGSGNQSGSSGEQKTGTTGAADDRSGWFYEYPGWNRRRTAFFITPGEGSEKQELSNNERRRKGLPLMKRRRKKKKN